jgi:flagellar assembly protein FliH
MSSSTDLSPSHPTNRRQFAPLRLGDRPVLVDAHEAARSAGYAEGWAQGRRDAVAAETEHLQQAEASRQQLERALAAETQKACDALWSAVSQLEAITAPVLEDSADVVLEAAIRLAEAVLGAELSVLDDAGTLALRRALSPLPDDGRVVVRLNPQDLQVLRAAGESADGATGTQRLEDHDVELVADSGLRRGEAVADQGAARVDARFGAALRRAIAAAGLLDVAAHPAPGDLA